MGRSQNGILQDLKQMGRDIGIHHFRGRIDDAEVHALLLSMIEENRMHGLTHKVISAERETEVAHSSAHMCSLQMSVNPFGSPDKVQSISIMFGHACSDGQDIGIEDDIPRIHPHLLHQQLVSPMTYFYLALIGVGLSLFVESHDHHSSPQLLEFPGMSQESGLSLLQTDTVGYALPLYTFQSGTYHVPVAAIHHDGYSADIGVAGQEIEEMSHLPLGIQQSIIHIHIDNHGPILHLLASYVESLFIGPFLDETEKLA